MRERETERETERERERVKSDGGELQGQGWIFVVC